MPKERPILFTGPMVRAIRDGRKTQTRRVVKPYYLPVLIGESHHILSVNGMSCTYQYRAHFDEASGEYVYETSSCKLFCPYGDVGDRLWVRETWALVYCHEDYDAPGYVDFFEDWVKPIPAGTPEGWNLIYKADDGWEKHRDDRGFKWRPPIPIPRWASRILLEITDVRVERLQEISYLDCIAEGVPPVPCYDDTPEPSTILAAARSVFCARWDEINGKKERSGWIANPWVYVVTFRNITPSTG